MELDGEDFITKSGRHSEFFKLGNRLLSIAMAAIKKNVVEGATSEGPRFGALTVILGLFAKSVKTFRSIHLLCERGYSEDANALLRTLAEAMATVTYIAKEDSESRAQQYIDFMSMQDRKLKNATEGNPGLQGVFTQHAIDQVERMADEAIQRMTDDEYERRYRRGCWYPDGIESLMRVTDLQSVYDLPFRISSRAVHATDLLDHFEWRQDGSLVIKPLPGDHWAGAVLPVANVFFLASMEETNTLADLDVDEEIGNIKPEVLTR